MSSICRFWESRARTSRPARLESSTASQALHVSYNWEPNLFFKRSSWYLFDCTTIYFLLCGGGGGPPPPLPWWWWGGAQRGSIWRDVEGEKKKNTPRKGICVQRGGGGGGGVAPE